VTFSVELR